MKIEDYEGFCVEFNPKNCTINNKQSFVIYDVPPTCFSFYKAVFREAVCEGIKNTAISVERVHV